MHIDKILLHFSNLLLSATAAEGHAGAFMSGKYLLGSTGIENMVSASILLSMEHA